MTLQARTANGVNEYESIDPDGPPAEGQPPNQAPVSMSYDFDGNLTADGSFAYTWDAENRLATVTPASAPEDGDLSLKERILASRRAEKYLSRGQSSVQNRRTMIKKPSRRGNVSAVMTSDQHFGPPLAAWQFAPLITRRVAFA